ncbi:MAG: hypothetical protein ACKOZX_14730, partial [Gammaproteobacteria bacterium]
MQRARLDITARATALLVALVLGTTTPGTARPESAPRDPAQRPVATAGALRTEPTLDGNVAEDPAWRGLTPATGFWQVQPNEGAPASQRNEVLIGYTDEAM